MPAVNPEILVWARETAGLTLQDAATRVGIRAARGVAAVDRLAALERGDDEPTRPVLVRMARHYRRPLLAFYLSAPPRRADRGADFRTLTGPRSSETDALVDALVRDVRSRQQMVRAALEAEDEAEPLPLVGVLTRSGDAAPATGSPDDMLDRQPRRALRGLQQLAVQHLSQMLGHDLDAARYHEQPTATQAFKLLRSQAENAGVFVLLKGNLGSHHTALPVKVFRGFVIADDVAPFVVVNDNDSEPAWSFTLLHELVHLLLGQTGISGARPGTKVEEFCNNVAAEWMLPARTLDRIEFARDRDVAECQQRIGEFARPRNLSHTMVAYRLLRTGRIDQRTFERLYSDFGKHWQQQRDRRRAQARGSDGGPDYYVVRRQRVGQALLGFARRMLESGALSTTKAARILGVKPAQVGRMLRSARSR